MLSSIALFSVFARLLHAPFLKLTDTSNAMELIDKPVPATASPFSALIGIFLEPTATFARLASRRAAWLPVLTVCAANIALFFWYFLGFVDYSWFQEQMLAAIPDPAMREQQGAMGMSQQTMAYMTAFGGAFSVVVSYALTALYLLIVGKFTNRELGFGKGFALAAWAAMPNVLMLVLGAMQMLLASSGQLGLEALNPTSLNQLFFHYEMGHPLAGLLDGISILFAWNLALLVIGYQVWSGASRASALRVVLIPTFVIYGAWLAFALSKAA